MYSLIAIPISGQSFPLPHPSNARLLKDYWDDRHVKMPYSKRNGNEWQHIKGLLKHGFKSVQQLEDSIKKYNKFYSNKNFNVLRQFFGHYKWEEFEPTVNFIAKLALNLPNIVTKSVPLLRQKESSILFISQYQIACLLANAFFCTFPRRSKRNDEYKNFSTINFGSLFTIENDQAELKIKVEKLKCIFGYFNQIRENKTGTGGVVTFERRHLPEEIYWKLSDKTLSDVKLEKGSIELEGKGFTEVDFANKYVGGGVLTLGCVQEELRFLMCPELIVSRLFTEKLSDTDTLVITGCRHYNTINGYSYQFEYTGNYGSPPQRDEWRRYYTEVVAMDAMEYHLKDDPTQFEEKFVVRTLNKAFCGFYDFNSYSDGISPAIASGKWGCGAFNGNPYLSCLLQHMAASQLDRNLILFIQNDKQLKDEYEKFHKFATSNKLKIDQIFNIIVAYNKSFHPGLPINILDFITNFVSKL